MNNIEAALDPDRFLRVHRSHIVNVKRIKQVWSLARGTYVIELASGATGAVGANLRRSRARPAGEPVLTRPRARPLGPFRPASFALVDGPAMSIDDLWYKNAVIYCLDVEKYQDANGDGIGDFEGLSRRLDYLAGLGVTCVWLQPFYPSPNRDNGYDVTDYYSVHEQARLARRLRRTS